MNPSGGPHLAGAHRFLGEDHAGAERRTWAVIALCTAMMLLEIVGGHVFGSIALVADGWHMSTHAGALLLAALAYTLARRYSDDPRFSFGAGKFGDLAGFSSAIVLGLIAAGVGFESALRLFRPEPIAFREAIAIAALGLAVNVASAWMLGAGGRDHGHSHGGDDHDHDHDHDHAAHGHSAAMGRDNNMRAALVHVVADAAVSVLVIAGLIVARLFGWLWIDPLVGLIGALVIANWAVGLARDTAGILLDVCPDNGLRDEIRAIVESHGDRVADLHLWRLGPGHLGAIVSVASRGQTTCEEYRSLINKLPMISHLTVEITRADRPSEAA